MTSVRLVLAGFEYDLDASALTELQEHVEQERYAATVRDNMPPEYDRVIHSWVIARMEEHDPRVRLVR